jgi:chemotaxis protein methyltransferase CheR
MKITIKSEEFHLFRTFIQKECGIVIGERKNYLIEHRLAPLLQKFGCRSCQDFYFRARHGRSGCLRHRVDALTTPETMWFRDGYSFAVLAERLLPRWLAEFKEGKRKDIRIWSAACSARQNRGSGSGIMKISKKETRREQPRVE